MYASDSEPYMVNVDFAFTAQLEAGKTYYIRYRVNLNPLVLSFKRQYSIDVENVDFMLPANLKRIEAEAFPGAAFESITVHEGVTTIGPKAFMNCANLRIVIFIGANTEIDDSAFVGCNSLLIVAPADSIAARFAADHGFEFSELK